MQQTRIQFEPGSAKYLLTVHLYINLYVDFKSAKHYFLPAY
jgi:hypothetical protein